MPKRKESEGRIRYVTEQEEKAALATLERWSFNDAMDLWIFLIDTGFRVGEALKITKRDVRLKDGTVSVWETKSGSPRTVRLTSRVRAVLEKRLAGAADTDKVFPMTYSSIRGWWARLAKHLGLENDPQFVPHALRHTCCSRLVQRGVHLAVAQKWMGHKTITVTMRYAHLAPQSFDEAIEALEQ